ncbi:MAG: hypothetical protein [Podoviridae sp. ctbh1]|nr:MAG: hypothetical protein [Podoviridae sp. ctbh1]
MAARGSRLIWMMLIASPLLLISFRPVSTSQSTQIATNILKSKIMIATLNKSKTNLSINKQEFKAALSKIGDGIDKQIASLKKAKQSYDASEMAREVVGEANIFEAIIEGFNEAEGTALKLADISNLEQAQGWIDEFLEKYST